MPQPALPGRAVTWRVVEGDALEQLAELDAQSIDAVVTDPPYGIGFMGHKWDQPGEHGAVTANGQPQPYPAAEDRELQRAMERSQRRGQHHQGTGFDARRADNGAFEAGRYDFSPAATHRFQTWSAVWAAEALRVLKPGGYLIVFGGTRTYHRLVCGIEDAGFEIRDQFAWLFGSGFPKGTDKARIPEPWRGEWNTALKPAHEPIVLARRPMAGTLAANLEAHGTGAMNVAGCAIDIADREEYERNCSGDRGHGGTRALEKRGATDIRTGGGMAGEARWPANVLLDEEAAGQLDAQTGELVSGANPTSRSSDKFRDVYGEFTGQRDAEPKRGRDTGGASRFFYCAKASRAERDIGMDGFEEKPLHWSSGDQAPGTFQGEGTRKAARNSHPTVKPIALMQWLVRLVTPAGGTVLDPFAGSGSTGIAALREGFSFVGIEREHEYVEIARARIRGDEPLMNAASEVL